MRIASLSHRTLTYFEFNTVTDTQTEHKKLLEFPAVTLCNFNM